MNYILVFILVVFSTSFTFAQSTKGDSLQTIFDIDDNLDDGENTVYTITESPALFPIGQTNLGKYIKKNVIYPSTLLKSKLIETVYVKFIIEINGDVSNIKILSDNKKEFIDEAKSVIQCMPKWIPAMQNGKKVRTYFTIPVKFCPEGCAGW